MRAAPKHAMWLTLGGLGLTVAAAVLSWWAVTSGTLQALLNKGEKAPTAQAATQTEEDTPRARQALAQDDAQPVHQVQARLEREVAAQEVVATPPTPEDTGLPVFPGATVVADQSERQRHGNVETVIVVLATKTDLDEVGQFYRQKLAALADPSRQLQEAKDGQSWRLRDDSSRQMLSVQLSTVGRTTLIRLDNARWH